MLSFAVTHEEEDEGRGSCRENMEMLFTSSYPSSGLDVMKRGNGSAALCAVSNWIWQYII